MLRPAGRPGIVRRVHAFSRILCLLLLVPTVGFADDVHLKGGAVLSGRIVEQNESMISVDIGDGVVGVPMNRVERIEKKRSVLDDFDERGAQLATDDVEGWRGLGRWASRQGLAAQSRRAWEHVRTLLPDDPEAMRALGYYLVDGRWLTEEDAYRALGYVKYDGEWMTSDEARMAQAADEAEEARRRAELRATEAEIAAQEAEERARAAEERAREAEQSQQQGQPIYYGGWGYGMNQWPRIEPNTPLPAYRPPEPPPDIKMPEGIPK